MFKHKNIMGMMLIEVMIAMTVGLLLTSFLVEIYLIGQRSFQMQTTLSRIQENAKTAIDSLSSEINRSGYIGCARLTQNFPLISHLSLTLTPQNKLLGNESEITIRHAGYPMMVLTEAMRDEYTLLTTNELHIKQNEILIISDCKHAEIFTANQVTQLRDKHKIIAAQPLQFRYDSFAEIAKFEINRYFIAKTNRIDRNGEPVYALYVEDIDGYQKELVEGVIGMHIKYTLTEQGSYVEVSNHINEWSDVVGVAIAFDFSEQEIKKTWYMYASLPK